MTILISSHLGIEMFMEADETKEAVCYNFTDINLAKTFYSSTVS